MDYQQNTIQQDKKKNRLLLFSLIVFTLLSIAIIGIYTYQNSTSRKSRADEVKEEPNFCPLAIEEGKRGIFNWYGPGDYYGISLDEYEVTCNGKKVDKIDIHIIECPPGLGEPKINGYVCYQAIFDTNQGTSCTVKLKNHTSSDPLPPICQKTDSCAGTPTPTITTTLTPSPTKVPGTCETACDDAHLCEKGLICVQKAGKGICYPPGPNCGPQEPGSPQGCRCETTPTPTPSDTLTPSETPTPSPTITPYSCIDRLVSNYKDDGSGHLIENPDYTENSIIPICPFCLEYDQRDRTKCVKFQTGLPAGYLPTRTNNGQDLPTYACDLPLGRAPDDAHCKPKGSPCTCTAWECRSSKMGLFWSICEGRWWEDRDGQHCDKWRIMGRDECEEFGKDEDGNETCVKFKQSASCGKPPPPMCPVKQVRGNCI